MKFDLKPRHWTKLHQKLHLKRIALKDNCTKKKLHLKRSCTKNNLHKKKRICTKKMNLNKKEFTQKMDLHKKIICTKFSIIILQDNGFCTTPSSKHLFHWLALESELNHTGNIGTLVTWLRSYSVFTHSFPCSPKYSVL